MNHLVVAQWQYEVFARCVHRPERDLTVVPAPVDGIELQVRERVMHPAHVPLVAEAEPADVGRATHHRPRRRLLGHRRHIGELVIDRFVELAEEHDRIEVLATAVLVGDPFAVVARVVEIQHRRHGIDPEPVDVVAIEPAHRTRHQERSHLVAAVVEDRRVPIGVEALAGIGVLEQVRPVELVEAVAVVRKV